MAGGTVLFTGFPGFIGTRVVRALLAADPKLSVAAVVEPRMAARARDVAVRLDGQRIEVLEGDIGERGLGIAADRLDSLRSEVTIAYHLAAIYDLAVPLDTAQRVNVDGTGNVLEVCAGCKKLERLNYVSTAYVAGDRKGVVYEHELALGQGFKNHYESTKFQAELWVRDAMDDVPVTIYRPAIVVGDSQSGETQKFDGPYYILRTISRAMRMGGRIPQFGASDAPFNVVPVDFVVDAISALELTKLLSREYAGKEPSVRLPPKVIERSLHMKSVRKPFSGAPPESIVYLNHSVRFDTRRADDLLARHGLHCPRFEEYVTPVVRFFREHEDDPAFAATG